jgi:hypothetical protein
MARNPFADPSERYQELEENPFADPGYHNAEPAYVPAAANPFADPEQENFVGAGRSSPTRNNFAEQHQQALHQPASYSAAETRIPVQSDRSSRPPQPADAKKKNWPRCCVCPPIRKKKPPSRCDEGFLVGKSRCQ